MEEFLEVWDQREKRFRTSLTCMDFNCSIFDIVITANKEQIDLWEGELKQLRSLPLRLGKVLLSSGRTIFEGRVSVWAFAELDSNLLPCANTMPAYRAYETKHPDFCLPGIAAPGAPATGIGRIQRGEVYLEQGRTTDLTIGICNGTRFYNPKAVRYYVEGIEQSVEGTHELIIVPIDGKQDYCLPGDLGSLSYDVFGKISRLLFGQVHDETACSPATVTTFPTVLKAIEKKGGVLMKSPPYDQ